LFANLFGGIVFKKGEEERGFVFRVKKVRIYE
jgi:hypothetical protein